jgi:hypothetical protein
LAFKPDTDDIREAPALEMIAGLLAAGASVCAFDPEAMPNVKNLLGDQIDYATDEYQALQNAAQQGQAATIQGNLGAQEQALGLTGAGALTKAGAERQAYQQSLLDQPLKTATAASGLMSGKTVPTGQTSTFVGPKAGSYAQSDLSSVLGILSMLGSMQGGSAGNNLMNWVGGKLSGADPSSWFGGNSGYQVNSGDYRDTTEEVQDWQNIPE